jgi:endonuclease G
MTIDDLEELTGIDFFCNLPDDIEEDRESTMAIRTWGLN